MFLKGKICNSFHWYVSKWSSCTARNNCHKPGYKTRIVKCQDRRGHILLDSKCSSKSNNARPKTREQCVPDSCLGTLLKSFKVQKGMWGECTAVPLNFWNQMRNELINQNETGEFPDCEKDSVGVPFVSENTFTCHVRYKTEKHKKIKIDLDTCAKTLDLVLTKWKFCFFACINTCALSMWSKWLYCPHCRNYKTRYKTRQLMSLQKVGQYNNVCPQMEKIKCISEVEVRKHQFKVSHWDKGATIKDKKKYRSHLPKISLKQRKVVCIDSNGHICNESSSDISSKRIMMSDYDCAVSQWTSWRNCKPQKNKELHGTKRKGYQFRTRFIKILPSGDGKPCPILIQNQTCSVFQNDSQIIDLDYKWFLSDWASCKKTSETLKNFEELGCNVTFTKRVVFCVKVLHVRKGLIKAVSDALCRHHEKPSTKTACDIHCLSGCNYGMWNEWSNCRNNMIRRIRKPSVSSHRCPQIIQKKKCGPYWLKTTSQECLLSNTTSQCGQGFLNHKFLCMNGDNKATNERQCRKLPKPDQYVNCYISCLNNTLQNSKFSFNINDSLTQMANNDYYWYASSWSSCVAMKIGTSYTRHCVLGYSRRKVFCVNKTPTHIVDSSFCAGLFKFHNLRRCNICRKNCIVSTWSDWEPSCSAICSVLKIKTPLVTHRKRFVISYGNKYGVNCPGELVETKECTLCPRYQWVAKDWDICIQRVPLNFMSSVHPDLLKGVQIRGVYCSNGARMVDDEMCLKTRKPKPKLSRDCFIDLLVSCNLLPWTEWSECTRKCGHGKESNWNVFKKIFVDLTKNKKKLSCIKLLFFNNHFAIATIAYCCSAYI